MLNHVHKDEPGTPIPHVKNIDKNLHNIHTHILVGFVVLFPPPPPPPPPPKVKFDVCVYFTQHCFCLLPPLMPVGILNASATSKKQKTPACIREIRFTNSGLRFTPKRGWQLWWYWENWHRCNICITFVNQIVYIISDWLNRWHMLSSFGIVFIWTDKISSVTELMTARLLMTYFETADLRCSDRVIIPASA